LCAGRDNGGAGSVEDEGIGRGTPRIVNRRSCGESGSMGKMADKVVRRVVRGGAKRACRDIRLFLRTRMIYIINGFQDI
jgi:hypothetical protein